MQLFEALVKVQKCPTCRMKFTKGGVNTLAASMIEKIPHRSVMNVLIRSPLMLASGFDWNMVLGIGQLVHFIFRCKYSDLGCSAAMLLRYIAKHEERCPERTVKCPFHACSKLVKLKDYDEHANETHAVLAEADFYEEKQNPDSPVVISTLLSSGTHLRNWNGLTKQRGEEFVTSESLTWPYVAFIMGRMFFLVKNYDAHLKIFTFCVLLADHPEVAGQYSAILTIRNGDGSVEDSHRCPVISIEEKFPSDRREIFDDARVWKVPYWDMKSLFRFKHQGTSRNIYMVNNIHDWSVGYDIEVKISKNRRIFALEPPDVYLSPVKQ